MALIGNYSTFNKTPIRQFSGGAASGFKDCFFQGGTQKNRYIGTFKNYTSTPPGYLHAGAWVLPMKPGGLTAKNNISIDISNGLIAKGNNLSSNINSSILETNITLAAIININSALSGNISISSSIIQTIQNITSNIAASGIITAADIQTLAVIYIQAALNGSITVSNAQLGALIDLTSSSSGSINGGAIANILVNIGASIGGPTSLSPEGLANAVWSKDISDFMDANTSGRKLNDSGLATNPWSAPLSSNNTAGTFGWLIQKLLTVGKFLGLK